jgi:hypothetical protein
VSGTTQEDYRVVVFRTDTDEELVDTGWVESDDTEYLVEGMLADVEWQVEVTVRDSADIESNTATRLITPDYNSPEVPIISFNVENDGGYIGLSIENPEPVGDRPNPDTNVIHRREVSTSATPDAFQVLGEVEENGSFRDYTAASGVEYEYRVRAVAGEFFTDSTITEVDDTLEIEGVWIHNPADAQTTVRQFRFGKDNRSTSIDIMGTVQTFAGRKFPVVDFGEHEEEDFSISVDIPHGPDYRTQEADLKDFAESKITLVLRDNRGRSAYGTLTGFNQSDQAWGISVAFKFSRVSFDIEEV